MFFKFTKCNPSQFSPVLSIHALLGFPVLCLSNLVPRAFSLAWGRNGEKTLGTRLFLVLYSPSIVLNRYIHILVNSMTI